MKAPRPRRGDLVLVLVVLTIIVAIASSSRTQSRPSLDERARALAGELRCPVCQGLSIADSPAPLAEQMRRVVREQLAAGATDQEVRDHFVARYGSWILLAPPPVGRDALLWLAPGILVLVGLIALTWRSRGVRRRVAGRASRLGGLATVLLGVAVLGALALPLALAVGGRSVGQEITGFSPAADPPSLAQLETRVTTRPRDVRALVGLAEAYVEAGRLDEAATLYRRALEEDPADVPALVGVGVILILAERPDAAVLAFDRALAVAPDEPGALIYRALARSRLEGPGSPAVRADAERFLAVAPDDPRAETARRLLTPSRGDGPEPQDR